MGSVVVAFGDLENASFHLALINRPQKVLSRSKAFGYHYDFAEVSQISALCCALLVTGFAGFTDGDF